MSPRLVDYLEGLVVWVPMAVAAAAAIAAAWTSAPQRRAHARAMERFEAGKGRDPRRFAFGPHKNWRENFRVFAIAFPAMAVVWWSLYALGGGKLD